MARIRGLEEYVKNKEYREALGLPKEKTENYELLAQGEYNINYAFTHPVTGKKLLLRVNCGSQMHLEHQIEYEAHALRLMECSGRTPKVLYVDGSRKFLDHGVLVMEYLPGKALDYHTDLKYAAECLADIHSVRIPESESGLIRPENPLTAILEECEEMVKIYMDSPLGKDQAGLPPPSFRKRSGHHDWRHNRKSLFLRHSRYSQPSTNFRVGTSDK